MTIQHPHLASDQLSNKYPQFVYIKNYLTTPAGRFSNKFKALDSVDGDMSKVTFEVDPRWKDVDFSIKPDEDYFELCRQRAIHIRNEYEYVRLFLSGGLDSYTVLKSFIDANVHIDEIVISMRCLYDDAEISSYEENIICREILEYHKDALVQTKITILHADRHYAHDFWSNPDWRYISFCGGSLELRAYIQNTNPFYAFPHLLDLFDQNVKVADVYGLEKSVVKKVNGEWFSVMLDVKQELTLGRPGAVPFFVDPAFPKLYVLDAHIHAEELDKGNSSVEVAQLTRYPHPCYNALSHLYHRKYMRVKLLTPCVKSLTFEIYVSLHKETEHLIPLYYNEMESAIKQYPTLISPEWTVTGGVRGHFGLASSLTRNFNTMCNNL